MFCWFFEVFGKQCSSSFHHGSIALCQMISCLKRKSDIHSGLFFSPCHFRDWRLRLAGNDIKIAFNSPSTKGTGTFDIISKLTNEYLWGQIWIWFNSRLYTIQHRDSKSGQVSNFYPTATRTEIYFCPETKIQQYTFLPIYYYVWKTVIVVAYRL